MESTSTPEEAGRYIYRGSKPQPDLYAGNDAPCVADGASAVLQLKIYYTSCKINSNRIKNKILILWL